MGHMDPHTSILALLIVGWIGGCFANALRLPRIVPMILLGIALYPAMAPSVMNAPTSLWSDAQNPASSIRTMALLIALARGGLSLKSSIFRELGVPVVLLATLPYAAELVTEALVAPSLLPYLYGDLTPGGRPTKLIAFTSASVWAPLSPSIVIPNMLAFVDMGLTKAGHLVLTGAPLEVSTALVTEGVMSGCLAALNAGNDTTATLGHIPTYIIGSILYGLAFAVGFYLYSLGRASERCTVWFGKPDPSEPKLAFLILFLLCYTTSIDNTDVPWLIGFFASLCMAVGTQYLCPATADELVMGLKPLWYIAECFLFVLTGCVIRPAIDSGYSLDLFGWFFAVLLCGQMARMTADLVVGVAWHAVLSRSSPTTWSKATWADVIRRVGFIWVSTIPKATLQASLGPKLTAPFKTAGALGASTFVAPAAAIAILYCATIGSLLTFTAGKAIAVYFQEQPTPGAPLPIGGDTLGSLGGGGGDLPAKDDAESGERDAMAPSPSAAGGTDSGSSAGSSGTAEPETPGPQRRVPGGEGGGGVGAGSYAGSYDGSLLETGDAASAGGSPPMSPVLLSASAVMQHRPARGGVASFGRGGYALGETAQA